MRLGATLAHLSDAPPVRGRALGRPPGDGGLREPVDAPHHRARVTGAGPVRDARGGGHGHPRGRAGHGHRAGAALPPGRARLSGAVADVGVRRPADAGGQPRIDRDRLRHAGPGLHHPLRDLPPQQRPAPGPARARAGRTRRPHRRRPGRGGRRCCSARGAPTSSGPRGTSTAGWPPGTAARRTRSSPRTSATGPPAAGGRSCVPSRWTAGDDLEPTGEVLHRYAEAGFDDAVVVIGPGGPDPEEVRALFPRESPTP